MSMNIIFVPRATSTYKYTDVDLDMDMDCNRLWRTLSDPFRPLRDFETPLLHAYHKDTSTTNNSTPQ